jgi:TfoX/Sxy family transcriptional regulator of competence genes
MTRRALVGAVWWRHTPGVAYDRDLAERIRELVAAVPAVTEKEMFGGLAFLVAGNMAVAASGRGGLMVRVDPADSDALSGSAGVELFEMGGRTMRGWLSVDDAQVVTAEALAAWVDRGVAFASSLPAKR